MVLVFSGQIIGRIMGIVTSSLIVSLIDQVTAPARAVSSALLRISESQRKTNAALQAARSSMFDATVAGFVLKNAISAPVRAAIEFQSQMTDIAKVGDLSRDSLASLGEQFEEVGRQTNQSTSDIAKSAQILAAAGMSAQESVKLLPQIGRVATAMTADMTDITNLAYAATENLKIPVSELGKAMDAAAEAGQQGKFELADMAKYIPSLAGQYSAMGATGVQALADITSALQVVNKAYPDPSTTAAYMTDLLGKRTASITVHKFAEMGSDLMKGLDTAMKKGMNPIEAFLDVTQKTLEKKYPGTGLKHLNLLLENEQAQGATLALLQHYKEYIKIRDAARNANGTVQNSWLKEIETAAFSEKKALIEYENAKRSFGNSLLPSYTDALNGITPYLRAVNDAIKAHSRFTAGVVGTTASLVGVRIAAAAAKYAFLWMKGGTLAAQAAGVRMLGLAFVALQLSITGAKLAIGLFRITLISLFNPIKAAKLAVMLMLSPFAGLGVAIRIVTAALRIMKVVALGLGGGLILAGIAAIGVKIYNNWHGLTVMFQSIGSAFMQALGPTATKRLMPLIHWMSDLLGPINTTDEAWKKWGETIGTFVGGAVSGLIDRISALVGWLKDLYDKAKIFLGFWGGSDADWRGASFGPPPAFAPNLPAPMTFAPPPSRGSAAATGSAASGAGAGNQQAFHITINSQPNQSPMEIAQAVKRALGLETNSLYGAAFSDGMM
ncbi:MAG: phage tail tape measure protein [Acetobacter sp.]|nr:phage tail tape measure protein [Acetobacter sp.]